MAQFDAHRNMGQHGDEIPDVVLVQSFLYDIYRRRVAVPMVRKAALGKVSNPRFNPSFKIEKFQVVLRPLEMVSVPNELLGEHVESLRSDDRRIMDAFDELLTQAWG
jgi:toxin CcdB